MHFIDYEMCKKKMQSFLAVDFNKQTQKITLTILYFLYKKEFEQKLPYFSHQIL